MNSMSEYRGYNSTILLIHAAIFAYQKSLEKMVGSGSGAILRFAIPYLSEMLHLEGLPDLRKENSEFTETGSLTTITIKQGEVSQYLN